MKLFGGGSKIQRDPELERQRAEAAKKAADEAEAKAARDREEALAFSKGLRGRRALLSSAGGELGFRLPLGGA